MSTANKDKFSTVSIFPEWTLQVDERAYHASAAAGEYVSSTMLREFQRCPAHYHELISGMAERRDSDAMRFGRAAHTFILEGDASFRARYVVGGPVSEKTGRSFTPGTKIFDEWLLDNGLDRKAVVTGSEYTDLCRMRAALRAHRELSGLMAAGWPELSARSEMEGVPCQARLDWLCPGNTVIDVKTTNDLGRFEQDAMRFGYVRQFAFYRDVCRAAGAGDLDMIAAVLEKKAPYRVGVWHFSAHILEPYAEQNRQDLRALAQCRRLQKWPTGYERLREFPLAGVPPVCLN